MANHLLDWQIRGGMTDIWLRYSDRISEIIKKNELRPVDARHLTTPNEVNFALAGLKASPGLATAAADNTAAAAAWNPARNFDIRGGIRAAHVHFQGSIYALNTEHWTAFTTNVINDFVVKLQSTKSVSFEQALNLSEAAAEIGGH
jgi:hypothetical protein